MTVRRSRRLPLVIEQIGMVGVRQEAEQPIGRLARLRGGAHDRAIVLPQHLEPM